MSNYSNFPYTVHTESYYSCNGGPASIMGGDFIDVVVNSNEEAEIFAKQELEKMGRTVVSVKATTRTDVIFVLKDGSWDFQYPEYYYREKKTEKKTQSKGINLLYNLKNIFIKGEQK